MSLNMPDVIDWFAAHAGWIAGAVTAGVAVLLVCCIKCCRCSAREQDDIFKRDDL